jgi:hypothetical protein
VVAKPVIRELGAQAHLDGGNGFTFGVLHGIEDDRARTAERELPATWRKLTNPKVTTWLEH